MSDMRNMKSIAIGAALFSTGLLPGCGDDNSGPLGNVDSLVILQRPKRNDMGDIFQYTSYVPTARLVKLSPPTADGTLTKEIMPDALHPGEKGYEIWAAAIKQPLAEMMK